MSIQDEHISNALRESIIAGQIEVISDDVVCFNMIETVTGVPDRYRDFYEVPGATVLSMSDGNQLKNDDILDFIEENSGFDPVSLSYYYCGDSQTDNCYKITGSFAKFVDTILEIPQHHFFYAPEISAVIYIAFTGDLIFIRESILRK